MESSVSGWELQAFLWGLKAKGKKKDSQSVLFDFVISSMPAAYLIWLRLL